MTHAMGKGGIFLATAGAVAMSAIVFLLGSSQPLSGDLGTCLPSPNNWDLIPLASWVINITLLLGTAAGLHIANKNYSFIPGADPILPGLFMLMTASIPWVCGLLTSSTILCSVLLIALCVLFSAFRQSNATQEIFMVATLMSLGSMIQYAFLFMTLPLIVIALMFKCFRIREALALLLGLFAPYWVGLGLGLISPENLTIPQFSNLFSGYAPKGVLFTGLINLAITGIITLILSLYNSVKLYAGNSRRRLFNMSFNVLGLACVACMVFDFNNLTAYLATFYMTAAVQFAGFFALWNIRRPWVWTLIICSIYLTLFIVSIA